MKRLLQKFRKCRKGAIAVETAMVTPVLILILLPALDTGHQIYMMQKMNKATDSGIEYVVNGGRDENIMRSIIQDSFGSQINSSDLAISAYCGCLAPVDDDNDQTGTSQDPFAGVYVKTSTQLAENMCPTACSGSEDATELVEVSLNRRVIGSLKDRELNSRLQTRIK